MFKGFISISWFYFALVIWKKSNIIYIILNPLQDSAKYFSKFSWTL